MACEVSRDGGTTIYAIKEDKPVKSLARDKRGYEAIHAWWTRAGKGDSLLLRQENGTKADVIEVSLRQAYDLLDALNKALGMPQAAPWVRPRRKGQ